MKLKPGFCGLVFQLGNTRLSADQAEALSCEFMAHAFCHNAKGLVVELDDGRGVEGDTVVIFSRPSYRDGFSRAVECFSS